MYEAGNNNPAGADEGGAPLSRFAWEYLTGALVAIICAWMFADI